MAHRVVSRSSLTFLLASLLNSCFSQTILPGEVTAAAIGPATAPLNGVNGGELLLGELNCIACHQTEAAVNARLFPRQSPPLGEGGLRLTPQYLRSFLNAPFAEKPGTTMPDLLHALSGPQKAEAVEALAHFICWLKGTNNSNPVRANQLQMWQGRLLYHQIGCVACHSPQEAAAAFASNPSGTGNATPFERRSFENASVPLGNLAKKTTVPELSSFLMNPLSARPSGRMPSLNLKEGEATAIAMYLLREQSSASIASQSANAPSHQALPMAPLEHESLVVDLEKANRGKDLFASFGCAACHQLGSLAMASTLKAKAFAELDAEATDSCLGATPQKAPKHAMSAQQRAAIKSTLAAREELSKPLSASKQVARIMAALNCFACHSRDGLGGPTASRAEYFTVVGTADLGDEGRIPPTLTGVGDKLRPEWLRAVLLNKGVARPYMATRMPQFSPAGVGRLTAGFIQADAAVSERDVSPQNDDVPIHDVGYGRKLVGTEGFSCISCHLFAQHKSLGIPAMDLTLMTRRLKKDWFHRYLLDPSALRPGTRMPSFFPEGKSVRQDILKGDPGRQINALWAYLGRSKEAGLPPGLIQGKMELVATNEAVIYRNFIQGAGARGIGVGYPEKANIAFDANELRLALIWQGPFIDAARHRNGRGDGFEGPLGYNVVKMPAGAPFAILTGAASKWPEVSGKKAGYQMQGYQLDGQRRPTFLYSFANIGVEDYVVAVSGDLDASLRRALSLQSEHPVENLWFRAWAGTKIEPQRDGSFLADGRIKLHFELAGAAKPAVRQSEGKSELLVPIVFQGKKAALVEELVW